MKKWRIQRQVLYAAAVLLPILLVAGYYAYGVFFPTPTCGDGVMNGTEAGVDCGGECDRICQSTTDEVSVAWARSFSVSDTIYNAAAYIENPNTRLTAEDVGYRFRVFDTDGLLITERTGQVDIYPRPQTVVFEPGIDTGGKAVGRTEFELLEAPFWESSPLAGTRFRTENQTLTGPTSTRPRLEADIVNPSVRRFADLGLTAIVSDGSGNPVHTSRTNLDTLAANASERVQFTWRNPFPTESISCTVPADTALLIDRSGSMNDLSETPPQPLTDVKLAAASFVEFLDISARSALVTFATETSVDQSLTMEHARTAQAVEDIRILPADENGYTNLGAAVRKANTLFAEDSSEHTAVLVILTDGQANAPQDPGGEVYAAEQIETAKRVGTEVYVIGLGSRVNESFLADIATPDNFYQAATSDDVAEIYAEIYESLCEQAPYITEIIPTSYQLAD